MWHKIDKALDKGACWLLETDSPEKIAKVATIIIVGAMAAYFVFSGISSIF